MLAEYRRKGWICVRVVKQIWLNACIRGSVVRYKLSSRTQDTERSMKRVGRGKGERLPVETGNRTRDPNGIGGRNQRQGRNRDDRQRSERAAYVGEIKKFR